MSAEKTIDGVLFAELIKGGAGNLRANAKIVNDLNVFPIPDGDTGENMTLTITGGISYLKGKEENKISTISHVIADGMLMNARGNSGVILSQFFAGIAKGLEGLDVADVQQIGAALSEGVKSAYNAVINPTEGTILTVCRESTEYANSHLGESSTFNSYFSDFLKELKRSLERTPELLPCLKEAGVIDSGGAGLFYIAEGVKKVYLGESIEVGKDVSSGKPAISLDFDKFDENSVMEFGYCTEFLLRLTRHKTDIEKFSIDEFIAHLTTLGNSIVCFQNGTIVKTHIHTMTPGVVYNYAQQFGEFLTLKCENMTLQHHDSVVENNFHEFSEKPKSHERKKYAMVAVATGEGIIKIFKELGADYVIEGGQQHNPSTASFIEAFDAVNSENIFVLPNNKNIMLAAKQAASLYEKANIVVIESKSIGEGYVALTMLSYDSDSVKEITENFVSSLQGVKTISVSKAVRDANINGVEIKENNYIGFEDKTMLASSTTNYETAILALEKGGNPEMEYLIVSYGQDVKEEEKEGFRKLLKEKFPSIEVYEIEGGQDVFDFLLIVQ